MRHFCVDAIIRIHRISFHFMKINKKNMKNRKIEDWLRQFYSEIRFVAVSRRLFHLNKCVIHFSGRQVFQINFGIYENQWKSLHNWQNLVIGTEFHETPLTLTCCSSEVRRFREMLRYNFNTYSRRYVDCRVPYPTTMVGRKTPSRYIQKYFSISRSRNSAIPTYIPRRMRRRISRRIHQLV